MQVLVTDAHASFAYCIFLLNCFETTENFIFPARVVQRFVFADVALEVSNNPGIEGLKVHCGVERDLSEPTRHV